jgi:mannose-6-phosphate isomerase
VPAVSRPVALSPNQPETFYRGSGRLAAFRGGDLPPRPEDWVASTTTRFHRAPSGLSTLADGTTLADAIAENPLAWLGPEHVDRYGADPALLVKLLDAGQRLPLHAHPSRAFATSHLASPYGKTEAWIVLDAAPGASVHLGFAREVSTDELAGWVRAQDVAAMLAATNEVPIAPGDTILCPAGMPHAIGENVMVIELQEPTDFSVLLEWDGFAVDTGDTTLGLPFELALSCVDRTAWPLSRLAALRGGSGASLLPPDAGGFFRAERLVDRSRCVGFAVLVVTTGSGTLSGEWGTLPIARGDTLVVPHAAGDCGISGDVGIVSCLPA